MFTNMLQAKASGGYTDLTDLTDFHGFDGFSRIFFFLFFIYFSTNFISLTATKKAL